LSSLEVESMPANGGQPSRRSLIVAGGFIAVAAAAFAVTPRRHEQTLGRSRLDDMIPSRIGPWSRAPDGGLILPDADQPSDVYDQVLARSYVAGDLPPMMLLVAYGAAQSGLMKVHRPEICYTSSGFAISADRAIDLPLVGGGPIAARSFLATREDRSEQVLYWTRISNAFPRDLAGQRLVMLELGLRGIIPDGVLVRCSTLGADIAKGEKGLLAFVDALIANAGPAGRGLLVGKARSTAPDEKGAAP
jgi:EpsI family protein